MVLHNNLIHLLSYAVDLSQHLQVEIHGIGISSRVCRKIDTGPLKGVLSGMTLYNDCSP
jgi:hypothetical protein